MKTQKTLVIAFLFVTLFSNAQITKGNFLVGGDGNFSSKKLTNNYADGTSETNSFRSIEITPNIGYFFVNKFAAGIKLGYLGDFYKGNSSSPEQHYNTIYTGPFLRYYFLNSEKIINVFIESSFTIGNKHSSSAAFESSNTSINSVYLSGGTALIFNSSVSLDLILKYSIIKEKVNNNELKTNNFQIGLGFQIFLENNK